MDSMSPTIAILLFSEWVMFPNNSQQCLQRLNSLKGKFAKNSNFRDHYSEFMKKIEKGYAEPVRISQLNRDNRKVWYLCIDTLTLDA
jgi:hypothetical protein